ncbi:hypothetical protein IFM89_013873 [Coptis chinensis]|uniref:Endonuclease/exonuclease/phosphatase domain-containing protein n=1 Tax=Coptis chinensis TaxID=261450 RepID=A0A835HAM5_9MAGN|nr:hypothetical protein IFM89_013873 [Coptis chinensis]
MGFNDYFLHNNIPNRTGNIWVFWRKGLNVSLLGLSHQQITVKVGEATVSLVHARSPYVQRRALWDELNTLGINVGAWVVAGDFNIVTTATERKGGCSPCQLAVNEFVEFINKNALLDSTNLGYKFSWCNKRIGERRMLQKIDRMLVNQQWMEAAAGWKSKILKRKFSDHSPVVGWLTSIPKPTNIPFRFKRIWINHEGLKEVVKQSWEEPLEDVPIRKVMKKLKRLKLALKQWSWEVFGNLKIRREQAEAELEQVLREQEEHPFNGSDILPKIHVQKGLASS